MKNMVNLMKWNKKAEDSAPAGFGTLVKWVIIIAIGVILLVIAMKSSDIGKVAWQKIKDSFAFV